MSSKKQKVEFPLNKENTNELMGYLKADATMCKLMKAVLDNKFSRFLSVVEEDLEFNKTKSEGDMHVLPDFIDVFVLKNAKEDFIIKYLENFIIADTFAEEVCLSGSDNVKKALIGKYTLRDKEVGILLSQNNEEMIELLMETNASLFLENSLRKRNHVKELMSYYDAYRSNDEMWLLNPENREYLKVYLKRYRLSIDLYDKIIDDLELMTIASASEEGVPWDDLDLDLLFRFRKSGASNSLMLNSIRTHSFFNISEMNKIYEKVWDKDRDLYKIALSRVRRADITTIIKGDNEVMILPIIGEFDLTTTEEDVLITKGSFPILRALVYAKGGVKVSWIEYFLKQKHIHSLIYCIKNSKNICFNNILIEKDIMKLKRFDVAEAYVSTHGLLSNSYKLLSLYPAEQFLELCDELKKKNYCMKDVMKANRKGLRKVFRMRLRKAFKERFSYE